MEPKSEVEIASGPKNVHGKAIVQLSKAISWLLRHGAIKEGLTIRPDGFIMLDEVMSHKSIGGFKPTPTMADIFALVADNNKKRFEL